MTEPNSQLAYLRDPRLAVHALNPAPVWLWSTDSKHLLWANPAGVAIFDAASPGGVPALHFNAKHPAAAQVARLVATLPKAGAPRLERLRGFGAAFGGVLICVCSRLTLVDNTTGILIVSTERAARDLALPDRARRLLADFDKPAAMFTADGELIEAQPAAHAVLWRTARPLGARRGKARARGESQRSCRGRDLQRTNQRAEARRRIDFYIARRLCRTCSDAGH